MRFVHIADVHLGADIDIGSKWENTAKEEIKEGFIALVDYIESNNIEFLFITGDLFDDVPTVKDLEFVDSQLARLSATDIIYIAGQNDYLKQGAKIHKFRFVSRIYVAGLEDYVNGVRDEGDKGVKSTSVEPVVDCITFEKHKVEIYAISQTLPVNYENDLAYAYVHKHDYVNILLAYGGTEDEVPFVADGLSSMGFDYIGLGHMHNFEAFDNGKVCYAGSLLPLGPDETGEHGFVKGYVDKTTCSTKLVPMQGRRYMDLYKTVSATDTVAELEKYFDEIMSKDKNTIYSIYLEREANCYTEFDLSGLSKKYRLLRVTGDKPQLVDVEKLIAVNVGNSFGKNLKRINSIDSKNKQEAMSIYAYTMHDKLFGKDNPEMDFERAEEADIEKAHEEMFSEFKSELAEMYHEIEKCEVAGKELKASLEEYPDRTGDINLIRPKIADIKAEIDQIKFKDDQINKIYSMKRLKTVLAFVAPIALVFLIVSTVGVFDVFVMRIWDLWFNFLIILILLMIFVAGIVFLLYNKTKIFRRKLFDGVDLSVLHANNNQKIANLEHELYENEQMIAKYEADQIKYQQFSERMEKLQEKSKKITNRFKLLMLITGK